MIYIISAAVTVSAANGLLIQLNKALTTETITLSAATGGTFAVITGAAAAGAQFRYNGLRGKGAITITPSAAVDATGSLLNRDV